MQEHTMNPTNVRRGRRGIDGMRGVLTRVRLFACSYAPLFLILAIRFDNPWLSAACYLLTAISTILGVSVIGAIKRKTPGDYLITKTDDRGPEVSGYLATYLLPFVTVSQPSVHDLVGYTVFLIVAATVYVRSEMMQINPTLYLLGWKVVAVKTADGLSTYLLTKRNIGAKSTIRAVRVQNTLLIEHSEVDVD